MLSLKKNILLLVLLASFPLYAAHLKPEPLFNQSITFFELQSSQGAMQEFVLSRHLNNEAHEVYLEDGLNPKHSYFLSFDEEGNLTQSWQGYLKENTFVKHGIYRKFYAEGSCALYIEYKENLASGTAKFYTPTGNLEKTVTYKDGLREGPYEIYSQSGNLIEKGFYKIGSKEGIILRFDEEGIVISQLSMKEGVPHYASTVLNHELRGLSKKYYHWGLLHSFKDQVAVETKNTHQVTLESRNYFLGSAHGDWMKFSDEGTLIQKLKVFKHFQKAKLQSYKEGELIGELSWSQGSLDLPATLYNQEGDLLFEGKKGDKETFLSAIDSKGRFIREVLRPKEVTLEVFKNKETNPAITYIYKPDLITIRSNTSNKTKQFPLAQQKKLSSSPKEGIITDYYPDGGIQQENTYTKGALTQVLYYFEGGQLQSQKTFNSKGPHGVWKEFLPTGKLLKEFHFKDGKKEGSQKIWHFDAPEVLSFTADYKEGLAEGTQTWFSKNGATLSKAHYKQGRLHGKKEVLGENQSLLIKSSYKEGALEGEYFQTLRDGRCIECLFKKGKLQGDYKVYYPPKEHTAPQLAYKAYYKEGLKEGTAEDYLIDGTLFRQLHYRLGLLEGKASQYDPKGNLTEEIPYKKDSKEGTAKKYFKDGTLERETPFSQNLKNGEERIYHPNGSLAGLNPYENNQLNGIQKRWNLEGKLIYSAEYKDDKLNGCCSKYNDEGELIYSEHYSNGRKTR